MLNAFMAVMGKIGAVTVNSNWGDFSGVGADGSSTPTRTLTVPAGNPGSLHFEVVNVGVSLSYSKNGGAAVPIAGSTDVTFANGDTLRFNADAGGGAGSCSIDVTDNLRDEVVGDASATMS